MYCLEHVLFEYQYDIETRINVFRLSFYWKIKSNDDIDGGILSLDHHIMHLSVVAWYRYPSNDSLV